MHVTLWKNQATTLVLPWEVMCNNQLHLIDLLIALCATEVHLSGGVQSWLS